MTRPRRRLTLSAMRGLVHLGLFALLLAALPARAEEPPERVRPFRDWSVDGGPLVRRAEGVETSLGFTLRASPRVSQRVRLRFGLAWWEGEQRLRSPMPTRIPDETLEHEEWTLELGAEVDLLPKAPVGLLVGGSIPVALGRASDAEEWERVGDSGLKLFVGPRIGIGRGVTLRPEVAVARHARSLGRLVVDPPFDAIVVRRDEWVTDVDVSVAVGWKF